MPEEIRTPLSAYSSISIWIGEPREDLDPARGDPVGVRARGREAPAQLEDAERAALAVSDPGGGERDDRVGDGELGRIGDGVVGVLADPERVGREGAEAAGELVQEAAESGGVGVRRERLEAVDDDDAGPALPEQFADAVGDRVQAAVVEDGAEILVEDRAPDGLREKKSRVCPYRMIFSSGSDTVDRYSAGRSGVAFANTYCWARMVLPVPGSPITMLMPCIGRPPPSTASRRGCPLDRRSLIGLPPAHCAGRRCARADP